MLTKENIISTINELNDRISFDDILDKMFLLEKIEKGIEQSEKGLVISDAELDKRIEVWSI